MTVQLPRAPEAVAAENEAQQAKHEQQLREEYSRDVRAVTELRRHLRKIVASLIAKSKYTDFLYPMSPDDNPEAFYKVWGTHPPGRSCNLQGFISSCEDATHPVIVTVNPKPYFSLVCKCNTMPCSTTLL